LILAPLYIFRAADIDAKQIRRADLVSGNEPPNLSYDNTYSNRLFIRGVFTLLRFIVQRLRFCQMQNLKDDHVRGQLGYFFLQNPGRKQVGIKVELEKQSNRL
jgi:hypothetical protein